MVAGSNSSTGPSSPLRTPQLERTKSMCDAGRVQQKQSNVTPMKHQSVGEKSAGLKCRAKSPNRTPAADRYVVFYCFETLSSNSCMHSRIYHA